MLSLKQIEKTLWKGESPTFKMNNFWKRIWDKISSSIKKGFDSEPVYNDKYLKTKIKSYDRKINTFFLTMVFLKKVVIVFVYQQYS